MPVPGQTLRSTGATPTGAMVLRSHWTVSVHGIRHHVPITNNTYTCHITGRDNYILFHVNNLIKFEISSFILKIWFIV